MVANAGTKCSEINYLRNMSIQVAIDFYNQISNLPTKNSIYDIQYIFSPFFLVLLYHYVSPFLLWFVKAASSILEIPVSLKYERFPKNSGFLENQHYIQDFPTNFLRTLSFLTYSIFY